MASLMLTMAVSCTLCGQVSAQSPADESPATATSPAAGTPAAYLPPPEDREPVERTLKGYHEYSDQLQRWFKQQATSDKPAEQLQAIVGLCALYHELRTDPRYPTSEALQQMKIKIWSRLSQVRRELEIEIERTADDSASRGDALAEASDTELLRSFNGNSPREAFGGGARRGDHGEELVALIERTIAPTKWDVNGGPFTIVYYAPLHALVVRASSEVHGHVGGLLGGIRRAGN